jgi:hypothetical protein
MAISKTSKLTRVEVHVMGEGVDPRVHVTYENTFDDPSDDQLPVVSIQNKLLTKTTIDASDPDNHVEVDTDISGEDGMVQDICNVVWA